jgi:hypothetical protein
VRRLERLERARQRFVKARDVFFHCVVVHANKCTSESCTSSKTPTTRLGGQHGEEGKEGQGEEDEAESEALSRRLEVFDVIVEDFID